MLAAVDSGTVWTDNAWYKLILSAWCMRSFLHKYTPIQGVCVLSLHAASMPRRRLQTHWMCHEDDLNADSNVTVDAEWLDRIPVTEQQRVAPDSGLRVLNEHLNNLLEPSSAGRSALGIKSPMGSGKSTMEASLVQELEELHSETRVCILTYRQSLALNLMSTRLKRLGFRSYLHAGRDVHLPSQDRVIIQIDSICKLCELQDIARIIPSYDLWS